eukprot:9834-Heterococcus_DN1.PRE.3
MKSACTIRLTAMFSGQLQHTALVTALHCWLQRSAIRAQRLSCIRPRSFQAQKDTGAMLITTSTHYNIAILHRQQLQLACRSDLTNQTERSEPEKPEAFLAVHTRDTFAYVSTAQYCHVCYGRHWQSVLVFASSVQTMYHQVHYNCYNIGASHCGNAQITLLHCHIFTVYHVDGCSLISNHTHCMQLHSTFCVLPPRQSNLLQLLAPRVRGSNSSVMQLLDYSLTVLQNTRVTHCHWHYCRHDADCAVMLTPTTTACATAILIQALMEEGDALDEIVTEQRTAAAAKEKERAIVSQTCVSDVFSLRMATALFFYQSMQQQHSRADTNDISMLLMKCIESTADCF